MAKSPVDPVSGCSKPVQKVLLTFSKYVVFGDTGFDVSKNNGWNTIRKSFFCRLLITTNNTEVCLVLEQIYYPVHGSNLAAWTGLRNEWYWHTNWVSDLECVTVIACAVFVLAVFWKSSFYWSRDKLTGKGRNGSYWSRKRICPRKITEVKGKRSICATFQAL